MTQEHPITPPPELIQQWLGEYFGTTVTGEISDVEHVLATRAARWGADMELEACCEWVVRNYNYPEAGNPLRAARRPKPPSLKEQALAQTDALLNDPSRALLMEVRETLELNRRALEALPDD